MILLIFGENYDWTEYRRVRKAIDILVKRNGEELWPHLVKHLDDQRYSLTCSIDDFGTNLTVGDFCRDMVRRNLAEPYGCLWPSTSTLPLPSYARVIGFARPPWQQTLDKWSHSWKDKRLWELQVELGEWGIQKMEGRDAPVEPREQGPRKNGRNAHEHWRDADTSPIREPAYWEFAGSTRNIGRA